MPIPTVYGTMPFVNAEQVCVSPQFKRDNPMYGVVGADNVIYTFLNSDRAAARAYFEGLPGFTSWIELDSSTSLVAPAGAGTPGTPGTPGTNNACLTDTGTQLIVTLSAPLNGFAAGVHILTKVTSFTWIKSGTGFQRILVRSDPGATSTVRTISTMPSSGTPQTKELSGDPASYNHPENNVCTGPGNTHAQYNNDGSGPLLGTILIGAQS